MKRALFGFIVAAVLCGCTPKAMIKVDAPPSSGSSTFVTDEAAPDSYATFMIAEGNIYSCRYGIHFYQRSEFTPPKQELFARLIAAAKPAITSHRVRLQRFDVYRNYRPRLLKLAGDMMGGAIVPGEARKLEGEHNPDAVPEGFSLQQDPGDGRGTRSENQIGCDGVREGEYFPSDVTRGRDVIVIWLDFSVDDSPYRFRSAYQFHYTDLPGNDKAVEIAIRATIREAAAKLSL